MLKAFLAGAISVVTFHQGMFALLKLAGLTDRSPYSMQATEPFGVPQVLSLAFWGGLWGIVLFLIVRNVRTKARWWTLVMVIGTLATSLVAWFVAAPIKGQPVAGGGDPTAIAMALLVNGAWALGFGVLLRAMRRAG